MTLEEAVKNLTFVFIVQDGQTATEEDIRCGICGGCHGEILEGGKQVRMTVCPEATDQQRQEVIDLWNRKVKEGAL